MSHLRFSTLLALLILVTACEKTVDLDLKTSPSRLVIEATLAADGSPAVATLTRTVNYDQTNAFPAVRGAALYLTDDNGGRDTLLETTPGRYVGSRLRGEVGRRYTLRVVADGAEYVALATLPAPVAIIELKMEESGFGLSDRYNVVPVYRDPAGGPNYYYFRQWVNGKLRDDLFLQDDRFSDGKTNALALRSNDPDDALRAGDSVRVVLRNLDFGAYEYFRTLNQTLDANPLFATTPANPKSNFSGGALGYFAAYSEQEAAVVVP